MDKDFGICGREKEIRSIFEFVVQHVDKNESGILYLTGPPGTGKTMSINLVLERMKHVAKLRLNCFKAQTAKVVLKKICESLDITPPSRSCESSMIDLLARKITGRTCKPFILVLDEMDQLPKSNGTNVFRTIFSWTKQTHSKLIIIGIANTVNLTARSQTFASFFGSEDRQVDKIIFKPYTSRDIQAILNWYLDNDENFEEANLEPKVVDLISKRVAREKGDIRVAIDYLRDTIYDQFAENRRLKQTVREPYLTPPSTPPPTPCKEKTNLTAAVRSAKKRQRESHYFEDKAPPISEIILVCLMKLCSARKDSSVDSKFFYGKARDIVGKYAKSSSVNHIDIKSVLEHLELQGTVCLKKKARMAPEKIMLKASESEISRLSQHKQDLVDFVSNLL